MDREGVRAKTQRPADDTSVLATRVQKQEISTRTPACIEPNKPKGAPRPQTFGSPLGIWRQAPEDVETKRSLWQGTRLGAAFDTYPRKPT
jgi:hypothetical protein